jgi:hypothetical protein
MVDTLDDGGYVKVVEDVVNREIVVIEVLSSEEIPLCLGINLSSECHLNAHPAQCTKNISSVIFQAKTTNCVDYS